MVELEESSGDQRNVVVGLQGVSVAIGKPNPIVCNARNRFQLGRSSSGAVKTRLKFAQNGKSTMLITISNPGMPVDTSANMYELCALVQW